MGAIEDKEYCQRQEIKEMMLLPKVEIKETATGKNRTIQPRAEKRSRENTYRRQKFQFEEITPIRNCQTKNHIQLKQITEAKN
jgi:hypothetical protein